ncbi:ubiquinone-binding protein [Candidatus Palibaumannia cicadellinicola]|uniref:Putative oligoketide cyclase/dehydratase or lipid transport protein YfjG 50S ribosomal subunit-binding toxin of a predicted toxin-antitoxin pair n=1 Tax=Candidatus Palibaumannia cicadellinicola TaxID=186490 RepID=A0A088MYP0_9GAMM|nr:ubiquinone-binding protein [Candidatus Baumannia cicadellinicola]AIN47490.1 Putative oligoketide cyclase/dehydratase or lipid transport protein YfjG; 50S ribosomal subunit-binding toxin of a predicted toxin-antitoxin pair [Candidatus Baumannia cicadellinicola]
MPLITRSVIVPYSAEQMFALVNNISAYSEFIPGCIASRVLTQHGSELTAEMNVSKAGISKSFTTHNIMNKNKSIIMDLVEGPFSSFAGDWRFIPLSDDVSQVELHLNFEFKNKLIDMALGKIFKEMANGMVMAFTRRAKEVYSA